MKEGYWKSKTCEVDYIATDKGLYYELYCIQSKRIHQITKSKVRLFLENHEYICDLNTIYDSVVEVLKLKLN